MINLLKILLIFFLASLTAEIKASAIKVSSGELVTYPDFQSKYVQSRPIYVWLPDSYSINNQYSVLYMHDGQMLFDANTTWNKQEWGVDEVTSRLLKQGKIRDVIVVAIENIDELRYLEYFPQKATQYLSTVAKNSQHDFLNFDFKADSYLKFLVKELKPFIDNNYPTFPQAEHTYIAGSSMGGLISMYAMFEYPQVFGAAACISTHWPGFKPDDDFPVSEAIIKYVAATLPSLKNNRIYFDHGDQTLDAYYPPLQKEVDSIFKKAKYPTTLWQSRLFKGHAHDENSWQSRLDQPLLFLLGNN